MQVLLRKTLDTICKFAVRHMKKPCTRVFFVGKIYVTVVVKSQDEYAFSFSYKKPWSNNHRVFVISQLPHHVPEWIGRHSWTM